MASIISAGTTSGTALNLSGDTTGNLAFTTQAGANTITVPNVTGTLLTNKTTGIVLQVLSSTKSDTLSTTTTGSWIDVTGLSVSVTPSASTNKVFIIGRITGMGTSGTTRLQMRLVRDSTAISIGNAAGTRLQVSGNELYVAEIGAYLGSIVTFLDSPSTTYATTYKVQIRNGNALGTIYLNRSQEDTDGGQFPRGTSSITIMEIAA